MRCGYFHPRRFPEAERRNAEGAWSSWAIPVPARPPTSSACCFGACAGAGSLGLPKEMMPVFLPLRELKDLESGLDGFIQDQLSHRHAQNAPGFGRRLLERGNLLFLLDGLDEVAGSGPARGGLRAGSRRPSPFTRIAGLWSPAGLPDTPMTPASMRDFLEMHMRPMETAGRSVHPQLVPDRRKRLGKDTAQAENRRRRHRR